MKEIKRSSTNGRWGVIVVCEDNVEFPSKGILVYLGTIEGHKTFQFISNKGGDWIVIGDDLDPITGCKIIIKEDLQSSDIATILAGGGFMAWKRFGYKGRSSSIHAMKNGEEIKMPASIMAAMGLIPVKKAAVDTTPPSINSALADALKKAGL